MHVATDGSFFLSLSLSLSLSRHGAALKKNIPNLSRTVLKETIANDVEDIKCGNNEIKINKPPSIKSRKFSEAVDIEAVMRPLLAQAKTNNTDNTNDNKEAEIAKYHTVHAKPTSITLKNIYLTYGWSQAVTFIVGGFPITPAVAASPTMFSLGADDLGPQIGSVLLLFVFYLTDFQIVCYIPKPAFSAMLVLSFFDMMITWFYKSFFKTKDKREWIVVPVRTVIIMTYRYTLRENSLTCELTTKQTFSTFLSIGHRHLRFCFRFTVSCVYWYSIFNIYLRGGLLSKRCCQIRCEWAMHQFYNRTSISNG